MSSDMIDLVCKAGEIRIQGYYFISWPFIKICSFAIRAHKHYSSDSK
jgi:hypothetical protein